MAKEIPPGSGYIEVYISGVWYPLLCAKAFDFTLNQDEIEVTSVDSTSGREFIPGMSNATCTMNGLTFIENAESKISATYCLQLSVRRQILPFRVYLMSADATTLQIGFDGFFTGITISGGVDQFVQGDLSIRISGDVDISALIDPPVPGELDEIYIDLAEGATSVSNIVLDDSEIFLVEREGIQYDEVVGTPGNRQFQYDDSTDSIIFLVPGNPASPDLESIHILYKPN
jgi:predicted secreted protein